MFQSHTTKFWWEWNARKPKVYFFLPINCIQPYHELKFEYHINLLAINERLSWFYFRKQMKLFMDYQEKCNRFYMQVVSQLCFENSTPPSQDVMQHLLQLVMHKKKISELNVTIIRTRQMTIFETVVDTTPVFRSFLLQLLIRTK